MPTPITMDDVTFYAASRRDERTGALYQILYARIIKGLDSSSVGKIIRIKATDGSNNDTGYYDSWLTKAVFNGIGFAFICDDNTAIEHIERRIKNLVNLGSLCLDDGTWQDSVLMRLPKSMLQGDSIEYIDKSQLITLMKLTDGQPNNKTESAINSEIINEVTEEVKEKITEIIYSMDVGLAVEHTLTSNNINANEPFELDKESFKKMVQETLEYFCKSYCNPAFKELMARDNKDSQD